MGVVNRFLLMLQVASPARTKATLLGEAVLLTKDRVPLESVIPEGSSEEPPTLEPTDWSGNPQARCRSRPNAVGGSEHRQNHQASLAD